MKADVVQNGKTDTNNNGAFSTDYIGGSYDYPERQLRDAGAHLAGARRLHPGLPLLPRNRSARARRALGGDEEVGALPTTSSSTTNHWPYQLYIREARRMVGEYVMSQKDIQTELTKPDSIGMGSYNSDSHNVQRRPTADGTSVENEGDMQVRVTPYQIPYRLMLPKRGAGDEPARAGLLLGHPRRVLDAADGTAVHDPRPRGGRGGEDGDRRKTCRFRTWIRRRFARS